MLQKSALAWHFIIRMTCNGGADMDLKAREQPPGLELLSTAQLAVLTSIPESTLRWWRSIGQGQPALKVGPKLVRYCLDDVVAWLDLAKANVVPSHG